MSVTGRLAGLNAVVTGARRGIGREVALAFAAEGANLFLCDLAADGLTEVAEEAGGSGVDTAHATGDVTGPGEAERLIGEAEARFGRVDVLVNCAGIFQSRPFLEYSLEDWQGVMGVNVTGTMLCCQAALRRMAPRGSGKIINLSSVAGRLGGRFRAGYSTSKHAVIGLTRSLAAEFAGRGITVNAICPGMVDTDMFAAVVAQDAELAGESDKDAMLGTLLTRSPQGRLIQPREIARLAVYLASPDADSMTGQAVTLDGGMVMQ